MVKHIEIKDDGHLTVINVNGKYGKYTVHIQLGDVIVLPYAQKTNTYTNTLDDTIKGVVVGDH